MPLYDLVVLGATGSTGKLVVECLLDRYGVEPAEFKWAIAGRSLDKLHNFAASLKAEQLQCLEANNDDLESVQRLARQCKVIVTTVGPYKLHGSKLVKACSTAGKP
jgi:short subunit dehydrogenase-like uncharacterized protein